ncbi:MAG: glutamyl-tRNA reductase [Streptosporangiaceae bacterium]|nr:glutamyl-tRNA reductase [Streptosporangiaceae bacterium]
MSVLVVGLSHKSAPVATLELAAVSGDAVAKLVHDVARAEPVAETFVVSTCNRVEVYADVDRFHAGVTAICELLARHCGMPAADLTQHLYVHYEDRAVSHLLAVASGLDSMVVGEGQILGQVRSALKLAEEHGTLGRVLGDLGRLALRTGKRVRAETAINQVGASLMTVAIELAATSFGAATHPSGGPPLAGRNLLIVGAGSMSALAAATAARAGAERIVVANRTLEHAERLAAKFAKHNATVVSLAGLPAAIRAADVIISCTGASGYVITPDMIPAEADRRGALVLVDLAMPRDVEPAVADLPGVTVVGMDELSQHGTVAEAQDVSAVRSVIETELVAYQQANDAATVAPTVVALRAKAAKVVDAELARLAGRLTADGLSGHALDEIAQTVRRVVDKLLHAPTVRVKELAGSPGGEEYAAALRVLFDLDPRAVEAVTRAAMEQEGSQ